MKWLAILLALAALMILNRPQTRVLFQSKRQRAIPHQGVRPISSARRRRPRGGN